MLAELHSERFVDSSPAQVWATLLDEGTLPGLGAHDVPAAGRRARRASASAATSSRIPPTRKPELLAERPNEVWSWDITKLLGPAKWTYYYLYVILDVFSRYVVGWTVQHRENRPRSPRTLIAQACEQQQIAPRAR